MEPLASLPFEIDWARAAAVGARVAVILAVGGAAYTLLALLRRRIARMQADRGAEDYESYARRKTLATVVTTGGIAGSGAPSSFA